MATACTDRRGNLSSLLEKSLFDDVQRLNALKGPLGTPESKAQAFLGAMVRAKNVEEVRKLESQYYDSKDKGGRISPLSQKACQTIERHMSNVRADDVQATMNELDEFPIRYLEKTSPREDMGNVRFKAKSFKF